MALNCDFVDQNLSHTSTTSSNCNGVCSSTTGCTHFTWTTHQEGTCWLKNGSVSQSNAVYSSSNGSHCGIVSFPACSFRWGRDYPDVHGDSMDYSHYDYITTWLGCQDCPRTIYLNKVKSTGKTAVMYGYIIGYLGDYHNLSICHVGSASLCTQGANLIRNNRALIISSYLQYARTAAQILGAQATAVFLIEPDFYQYSALSGNPQQGDGLSGSYMRSLFDDIANAIKSSLPNALISWDISPLAIDQNHMSVWWGFFANSTNINFIHTSGAISKGDSSFILPDNQATWSSMYSLTGKHIIADSGLSIENYLFFS